MFFDKGLYDSIVYCVDIFGVEGFKNKLNDILKDGDLTISVCKDIEQSIIDIVCETLELNKKDVLFSQKALDGKRVWALVIITALFEEILKYKPREMVMAINPNMHRLSVYNYRKNLSNLDPKIPQHKEIYNAMLTIRIKVEEYLKTRKIK
jgi:hypothetical protein